MKYLIIILLVITYILAGFTIFLTVYYIDFNFLGVTAFLSVIAFLLHRSFKN